eukprot:Rhum_TRINITY_DN14942_c12_g1::Rhum_TRINITY_DN14942_c12_g1_i1::g.126810::m.126810
MRVRRQISLQPNPPADERREQQRHLPRRRGRPPPLPGTPLGHRRRTPVAAHAQRLPQLRLLHALLKCDRVVEGRAVRRVADVRHVRQPELLLPQLARVLDRVDQALPQKQQQRRQLFVHELGPRVRRTPPPRLRDQPRVLRRQLQAPRPPLLALQAALQLRHPLHQALLLAQQPRQHLQPPPFLALCGLRAADAALQRVGLLPRLRRRPPPLPLHAAPCLPRPPLQQLQRQRRLRPRLRRRLHPLLEQRLLARQRGHLAGEPLPLPLHHLQRRLPLRQPRLRLRAPLLGVGTRRRGHRRRERRRRLRLLRARLRRERPALRLLARLRQRADDLLLRPHVLRRLQRRCLLRARRALRPLLAGRRLQPQRAARPPQLRAGRLRLRERRLRRLRAPPLLLRP